MAETAIQYATDSSVFTALEALVLHNLPDFGSHGDGITNNNFLLAFLKSKDKTFRVTEGGLEFWHGVDDKRNTNSKWQAHTAEMSADLQDPSSRLRFPIKTYTDSIVINRLHEKMNKGRAAVKDWAARLTTQAKRTIPNDFNSAFWNASPGANEPESVKTIISTTPDTGTIGGLARSSSQALQNRLDDDAVTDLGSEDGIKALLLNARSVAQGSGGKDAVDMIFLSHTRYVSLEAFLTGLNRYRPDDVMAKLGFDSIKLTNQVTIAFENTNVSGSENSIDTNSAYGINSNHMFFKVLRGGNFEWETKFERVRQTQNKALYFYVYCNLTTDLPKAHFVMTSITG